ncbi:MAG: hypothetical protein DRQ13_03180 [Ignavibacteriae bacterium]|nr:MAG: hypothetical protein DRQ13_03180 [Ignavibacteriota bacterium]
MKKLLLVILLPFIIFAQEKYTGELEVKLINYGSSWNVTITFTAVGARWDDDYELTEDYESASVNINNIIYEFSAYFDHILDPGNNPEFAVGLYKISAIENVVTQAQFYMDWRTSNWSASLDVNFKYDVGNNRFRNWDNTETIDYTYQTLWDLTSNYLVTSGLEDYWDNCLASMPDADSHPIFVWGPFPDNLQGTITGYKIYRSATHIPGQQPSNFTLLETLDADEYYYVDNTVTIGNDYNAKSYYVTCIYEEASETIGETDPTNIVEVRLQAPQKISLPNNKLNQNIKYQLKQNYPNPFNPSTVISWQSPVDNFVTLKVFDVLGREITTLINGYKEAGTHSVEFNASNLPGGVYLYRIQIGTYTETGKLILQK